jgi:hypothetical protein
MLNNLETFMKKPFLSLAKIAGVAVAVSLVAACAQKTMTSSMTDSKSPMSFFLTSENAGKGADFGGLAGADAYCNKLASAVGAGGKNWKAYLSTTGANSVNARDRIGKGPWVNAKGVVVATSVDDLHSENNKLSKVNSITEKGEQISGRGDAVNFHDILTGSGEDGRVDAAAAANGDTTCGNWTLSGAGSAIVGHHDRVGLNESAPMKSWVASHGTRGCDMASLKATGGGGLMYCFAAN